MREDVSLADESDEIQVSDVRCQCYSDLSYEDGGEEGAGEVAMEEKDEGKRKGDREHENCTEPRREGKLKKKKTKTGAHLVIHFHSV